MREGVFVLDDLCTVSLAVGFTAGCLLCTNADTLQVCGGGDGGTLGNQDCQVVVEVDGGEFHLALTFIGHADTRQGDIALTGGKTVPESRPSKLMEVS